MRDHTDLLLSRWAFALFAIGFVGYNAVGTAVISSPGGSDYWEHIAAMYSFARDPLHPPNPFILSSEPTHLFTPYHLFWGLIARLLHLHPLHVLPATAAVNTSLFILSTWQFARRVIGDCRYALPLSLTMLFFWNDPWLWSGFYNFGQLPLTATYPYWFAFPVSILGVATFGPRLGPLPLALHGLAAACVFLTHPLTGSFLLLSLAARVFTVGSLLPSHRLLCLAVPYVAVGMAALTWPYYPVAQSVLRSSSFTDMDFAGAWQVFYESAARRVAPALLGLPFLVHLLIRKQFTSVLVGQALMASTYLLNYVFLHNAALARYIVFVAFYCHIGVVQTLKSSEKHPLYKEVVTWFLVALLICAWPQVWQSSEFVGAAKDFVRGRPIRTHTALSEFRHLSAFSQYVGTADVVLAPLTTSWHLAAIVGCKVVGVVHSNPFMSDFLERRVATESFFASGAVLPHKRRILSKYAVTYVLVPHDQKASVTALPYLRLLHEDNDYSLYRVQEESSSRSWPSPSRRGSMAERRLALHSSGATPSRAVSAGRRCFAT